MSIDLNLRKAIEYAISQAEEYSHEDANGGRPSEEADNLFNAIKNIAEAAGIPINPHKWYQ